MLKEGRYRALRNIIVGWCLQAVHSTDNSERCFRILFEVIINLLCLLIFFFPKISFHDVVFTFITTHTFFWFITGNFWVYMLDSFYFINNPGLSKILSFVELVNSLFLKADCCDAILIYGSMCRRQFHNRSDLDLRILRRTNSIKGLLALPIGLLLRFYSFFLILPVDLQVVDSMQFLDKQMRSDEKPIIVYAHNKLINDIDQAGLNFNNVRSNPTVVMKS